MLHNGSGGLDWSQLPLAVDFYAVDNVESLIDGLLVIKGYEKPKDDDDEDLPPLPTLEV